MLSFTAKTCYNRSCFRGNPPRAFFMSDDFGKEAAPFMPLVVVTIFFILLFSCEGVDRISREMDDQQALRRYREHEHHARQTSDHYLDLLG